MKSAQQYFLQALEDRLKHPLPGFHVQEKLEPATRKLLERFPSPDKPPRESAVLILLYFEKKDFHTVFIRRNQYDGVHSGQIAFPGGKMETDDPSHTHTALREAWEEIGLPMDTVKVLGLLSPLFIPPSNFNVQPVVGFTNKVIDFKADITEVAEIFTVPLQSLLDPLNQKKETIMVKDGLQIEVPCYVYDNKIVWGATSMILSEFIELASNVYLEMIRNY
jgi:8-oxo-dGTP pyrophosphatase MutT (NUDIX family)